MTPQEKDLITSLMDRLTKAGGEPKDREAEALIRQSVAEQPDAPYQLVQTVLIQDMALNQAQSRIADLEKKLAEATPRTQQPTSFLGGLAGRFGVPPQQPGPWRQQAPPSSGYSQASYGQGSYGQGSYGQGQGQGGYARPDYPQPAFPGGVQGGSGFLRSAATTAAGVAGGALLFEGIRSMFGNHADGILSGIAQQPAITETVINNYYGDEPVAADDYGAANADRGPDFAADESFDSGGGDIGDGGGFDDDEVV
jgi:hypothetical protein